MSLFWGCLIQATDDDGNPLSGARWVFQRTDTTAGRTVYSDYTYATPLGTSVTADAAGRFPAIFINDAISTRAKLLDSTGALIFSASPVTLSSGAGSIVSSIAISGGTTGLTASGSPVTSSGTITLGGTLAVASGGTGSTTAGGARTNLGAAAAGANTDITALDQDVTITATGTIAADSIGFRGLPQNSQTASYTLALSDAGKMVSITAGGVVIPANASIAFPTGTAVSIFNNSASTQALTITTDTLRWAGTTSTGTRTIAAYGFATAVKVASTTWAVSGNLT